MKLRKLYENDEVRVKEEKIKHLFFSNPTYLKEENELKRPEMFLKKNIGLVLEFDWDNRRKEWTYFVYFKDKKSEEEIYLWFLESELNLV